MNYSFLHRLMLACAEDGHSIFAPSYSATWMFCPGSLVPSILEEDDAGYEAAEGTVAHELAEEWLSSGRCPYHKVGTVVNYRENGKEFDIPITAEMIEYLREYVEMCLDEDGGETFVETKVWFSDLMPRGNPDADELNGEDETPVPFIPQGGTCDFARCRPGKLTITDLKYGQNVFVSTDDNTQLKLYGLGFFKKYDSSYHFDIIEIRICQPRKRNYGRFKMTRSEMLEFAERVKESAREAWQIDAPRRPSAKACEWCKISYKCPAAIARILDIKNGRYGLHSLEYTADDMASIKELLREELDLQLKETSLLTPDEISLLYQHRKPIEKWYKDAEKALFAMTSKGKKIPGIKLVRKRPSRQFRDEEEVEDELTFAGLSEHDLYKTEMLTPAQMEKVLKAEGYDKKSIEVLMKPLTFYKPGEIAVTTESDPRKDINEKVDDGVWDDD
ncbi:hypothetical protein CPT_Saba_073 [Proteus phage Saba]|uniref:DUF2800 domain-containing protein n=1 Tax=Proteus phage Saba TaxID=2596672 RepID=A0A5B9NA07_9CAUD|nr:exonuclease [Proteus phage Saba]QEG09446.1 hypothetical protein CPT_Saba_073 [Proteus phage Saba]